MKREEIRGRRRLFLDRFCPYSMTEWSKFNYGFLGNILSYKRTGRGENYTYNDVIIMGDTETSKKRSDAIYENHVVAWTISIRAFDRNIVTLYGHKPSEMVKCFRKICDSMPGAYTFVYFHNLSYDYVFLRKFLFAEFGLPQQQLNTKPHYPVSITWDSGLILRDSLILAQRNLDRWAKDMCVDSLKAVGKWDYDKLRNQDTEFTADELEYIEHDTLAGVECIDKLMKSLNKQIFSMPFTATGILREEVRKKGKENRQRDVFKSIVGDYEMQKILEMVYHGGYTHANRHYINETIHGDVQCKDFASSYPFVMLSEKYPMERFTETWDSDIDFILKNSDEYAYVFKLVMVKPRLKSDSIPMPALQLSKAVKAVNPIIDNGRILAAAYVEIWLNEIDLKVLAEQYDFDFAKCKNVYFAAKGYLPRWYTDMTFDLFKDKTLLKNSDKVLYGIQKGKLNSMYGNEVMKPVKDDIVEDYLTGDYKVDSGDPEQKYEKYLKSQNSILPYAWGVWVTSYAFSNLFTLGKCIDYEHGGIWLYSDTDSIYGYKWDDEKVEKYNRTCKDKLIANGYGCVEFNGSEYWLGIAENDSRYYEYRVQGAKRYCGRSFEDNELHITVAGVPKAGVKCLKSIEDFRPGMIFDGVTTGKKTHTYFFVDHIYIDDQGNETGDSIDLSPCDYLLDSVNVPDWEELYKEEIEVTVYEE